MSLEELQLKFEAAKNRECKAWSDIVDYLRKNESNLPKELLKLICSYEKAQVEEIEIGLEMLEKSKQEFTTHSLEKH